jgi:glucose/arabinose dehydrogenase
MDCDLQHAIASPRPGTRVAVNSCLTVGRVRLAVRGQNEREPMLMEMRQQVRDIRQGPDGLIYLVTRQDANQTPKSGMVLRIEPAS